MRNSIYNILRYISRRITFDYLFVLIQYLIGYA